MEVLVVYLVDESSLSCDQYISINQIFELNNNLKGTLKVI